MYMCNMLGCIYESSYKLTKEYNIFIPFFQFNDVFLSLARLIGQLINIIKNLYILLLIYYKISSNITVLQRQ